MEEELTVNQLGILRHSIGLDYKGRGTVYRNHFLAGPGHSDMPDIQVLKDLGYMMCSGKMEKDEWFKVTPRGIEKVFQTSQIQFKEIYLEELTREVTEHLSDYVYGLEEVPNVVLKMLIGLTHGTANKDSKAIKNTCRRLGIKYTYEALNWFLRGKGKDKKVSEKER